MNSLFEIYLIFAGYNIKHASNELKKIQTLSSIEFYKWQIKKKWEIARFHYENNSFYRKKVGDCFPDMWEDLPIMKKSDFQQGLEKMLSNGYNRKKTYIANTSGSSGHPFFFSKNKEAHAMDWTLIKNRYSWYGLKLNSKQARFYGVPLEKWPYLKEKVKDWLMNRVRFSVFDLSDYVFQNYLGKFSKIKFEFIYGYTNSLVLFARYLIEKKIILNDICPTLTHCITTSEVSTDEDREILSNAFGVKVVNEYGASEMGLIAFETPDNEWLLSEEILFYETINNEGLLNNNSGGNIILTDLDNKAMPFIRYSIGDIGVISKGCAFNNKNRRLEGLLGRENDTIVLPSGKVSPGLTFYYISRSILESSGILKEFIIRQTALDTFIFDIVSDRDLFKSEIDSIKDKMEKYLEPGLKIIINRVEKIERPPSGKLKHFYSELAK